MTVDVDLELVAVAGANPRAMSLDERRAWFWSGIPRDEAGAWMSWLLLRWRVDPVAFVVECCRGIPAPYQVAILLDLADAPGELYEFYGVDPTRPKRQVLIPSGHGLGKTRLLAWAIWWHKITHKFSLELCTAPTSDQLTGQLWGELRKIHRRIRKAWPAIADEWEILGTSIEHKNPEYGDWRTMARTARADKPEALQGAHALDVDDEFGQLAALFREDVERAPSGGILIVIEEASGVDDVIRRTLQGSLSEEGARLIAPGNPTRPDGWFADDMERTDRYAVHHLDCRMSDRTQVYTVPYRDFGGNIHHLRLHGFVRPEQWLEYLADCEGDEDHDVFRVRIRGLKPRSAFTQCIKEHWVSTAFLRQPDKASLEEPAVISLDFGLTGDKHALAVRRGFAVLDGDEWLPKDRPDEITLDAAHRAIEAQKIYGARYIIGDSNGVGRGAMEYLAKYYREAQDKTHPNYQPGLQVEVIHFNSGAGALDSTRFYCRRDEMWFKKGRAFFADPRVSMPEFPGVKSQLTAPSYHEDSNRKISVESKKEIKRRLRRPSGNLADALLMSLMVQVRPEKPKQESDTHAIPREFQRCFARYNARRLQGGRDIINRGGYGLFGIFQVLRQSARAICPGCLYQHCVSDRGRALSGIRGQGKGRNARRIKGAQ